MDKVKFFILLISNIVFAGNFEELLLDIQKTNKINLAKHNLMLGWNERESLFIARGEGLFDFNASTFIHDKREFSIVASVNAKAALSDYLNAKLSASNRLEHEKISSKIDFSSKNLLNNSFTIYQTISYDSKSNVYTIVDYTIYSKNLSQLKMKSEYSLDEYIQSIDLASMTGSRFFVDNQGDYYLLSFSIYEGSGNIWQDKISADNLAKNEIVSMLESHLSTVQTLENSAKESKYSSQKKRKSSDINTKNIVKKAQQKIQTSTGSYYYVTVYACRLHKHKKSKHQILEEQLNKW